MILYIDKYISPFDQIALWLKCVHGKDDLVGLNPISTKSLSDIKKPEVKMSITYINHYIYPVLLVIRSSGIKFNFGYGNERIFSVFLSHE